MAKEIRGEKVVFGREDYQPLEAMPSAQRDDAPVLSTPRRRHWPRRLAKLAAALILFAAISVGALFIALEQGFLDKAFTQRAEASLRQALGSEFEPVVGAVRLRFADNWLLAFEVRDVTITHVESGVTAFRSDSIRTVLDPIALLGGRIAISIAEIGIAEGDLAFLPQGPGFAWSALRIDTLPEALESFYPSLDAAVAMIDRSGTTDVSARSLTLRLPQATAMGDSVRLSGFDMSEDGDGRLSSRMAIAFGKFSPRLAVNVTRAEGRVTDLEIDLSGFSTEPFMMAHAKRTGEKRYGLEAPGRLVLKADRDGKGLMAMFSASAGDFYADGEIQPTREFSARMTYDFDRRKIEISDGRLDMNPTIIPFEGALIDLDRVNTTAGKGIAFDIVANDAVVDTLNGNEEPEAFNAATTGYFATENNVLHLDKLGISTNSGSFAGSLNAHFVEPSTAVTFSARISDMSVASFKQLWPFWFGQNSRNWVFANMKGGMVRNGEIDVSLAPGRIPDHPEPTVFNDNELHMAFDLEDSEIRFFPTLPKSVKTSGRFELQDRKLQARVTSGEVKLDSGKILRLRDSLFEIGDTKPTPMIASIDVAVEGEAAAAAEFASHPPIDAMARAPFAAADLSGSVKGRVKASFAIGEGVDAPPSHWDVSLDLDNVDLKKPFEGRQIADLKGTLKVDGKTAVLAAKAAIDGIAFDIDLSEPLVRKDGKDGSQREWSLDGKLTEAQVLKFAPSLKGFYTGSLGIVLKRGKDGSQDASLELSNAGLSLPFIGWRKGPGIAATAKFRFKQTDKVTNITNLLVDGDGFGARGELVLDNNGPVSAKLTQVRLSKADRFAVSLQRKAGGMNATITGASMDARPYIEALKSPAAAGAEKKTGNTISAKLDTVLGYNKESLSDVNLKMVTSNGRMSTVDFSAITKSGQAVVVKKDSANGAMDVTSGDAGAVARFADIYRNMTGGLLNIKLKAKDADSWRGALDIRNFALINEQRLKSIIQARNGTDGRSLSDAVQADIDTSSQKFSRGFARLLLDGQVMRIENGVVRGDQVGATFQGTIRDTNGQMDMTGTFMPAYGLNRLFGELPLIGVILGNGRDRGLLGITFKFSGPAENPKLSVNPLSLIAPGVFRNIFEFQ